MRPTLMTSFAFIFGVLPLAIATGAVCGCCLKGALGGIPVAHCCFVEGRSLSKCVSEDFEPPIHHKSVRGWSYQPAFAALALGFLTSADLGREN
jgi:hypothetical protein